MLRVAQPSVVLGEAASPVLYCFSMRSDAMAFPRTPRPACRFSSEYSANVPPAPQLCSQVSQGLHTAHKPSGKGALLGGYRVPCYGLPRTPRPACRFSSEYTANVPPAPQQHGMSTDLKSCYVIVCKLCILYCTEAYLSAKKGCAEVKFGKEGCSWS